ncbi:MAG: hypothetical protein ABJA02_16875 [Acidobacteriota bacterium]
MRTARFYYDDGTVLEMTVDNDESERFVRLPPAIDGGGTEAHLFRLRDREIRYPLAIQYDEIIWG